MLQNGIIKGLDFQGLGRHTKKEIYSLAAVDIRNLSNFLRDKPYFMGDRPTTVDATAFGLIVNLLLTIDTPILVLTKSHDNLVAYSKRMMERIFPEVKTVNFWNA